MKYDYRFPSRMQKVFRQIIQDYKHAKMFPCLKGTSWNRFANAHFLQALTNAVLTDTLAGDDKCCHTNNFL